ncbi:MAG: HD domain-containing protein [Anaeroplasmataceae bacterium]|nr:HD domain-containing protein [Anaeroplasmataceae bacterium]
MIEEVRKQVCKLLDKDNSGHGMEHVDRVFHLSMKFAEIESANNDVVALIALLHDVDDYKLFGMESAENLTNARHILNQCSIADNIQEQVLNAIKTIGYSNRLKGICPITLEGKIVSDADMCDSIGATGILRSYQYNLAHGNKFFDKNIFPTINISASEYMAKKAGTVVTHMFEKLLKLKDLMLTDSGKKEAIERHNIMIQFLYHFFEEENVPEWIDYLEDYLKHKN